MNIPLFFSTIEINGVYCLSAYWNAIYISTDETIWNYDKAKNISISTIFHTPHMEIGDTYYLGTFGNGLWISKVEF